MTEPPPQLCIASDYCAELKARLADNHIHSDYGAAGPIQLDSTRLKRTPITPAGPPPHLLNEDGGTSPADDGKNAILVHKHLKNMTSAQGADERLWTYLTHTAFHDYTKARWGIEGGADKAKHIRNRWFLRGGRQGLLSNSVARLWWAAHLTYAPWERDSYFEPLQERHTDDYVYTRWIFDNQNMFQGLVARRFGSSFRVRICMLEAFERRAKPFSNRSALSEAVERRINLVCSYRVLSALPLDSLLSMMEHHVQELMDALDDAAA